MSLPAAPRRPSLGGLRGQVGTEQEMSFNRLVFAAVFALYLPTLGAPIMAASLPLLAVWSACALGIFLHIRVFPGASTPRRAFALLADTGFLSGFLHLGGAWAAPFFPVYLWVALGNGFRFGPAWLFAGMAAFVAGFGAVALTTPFWRDLPQLATGLLLGPVILALYAATLIRKLSQARLAAEQASEAKTRFLAGVSHELRTPLNAIIGMGGLLRTTPLDGGQQEMAQTIDMAARGLLGQINGLLDIARIEAGATVMRSESVDLAALLAETRGLLLAQAREKGLLLRLHATPRTPCRILADATVLRDILLNLGGNAVKFTASGGVVIAVDAEPGAGPGEGDALLLRLEVSDTGIGIDDAAQSRIFERFAQADDSIAGRFGGTGLGLALCKGLVELAGGRLGLRSRPGEGSCFHVLLPVRRDPGLAPPGMPAQVLLLAEDLGAAAPVATVLALVGLGVVPRAVPPATYAALWGTASPPPAMLLACAGPGGLPETEAVAAALRGAGPAAELPILAVGGSGAGAGLPAEALRRRVAAWLPAAPEPADLAMPLALAAAQLPRPAAPAVAHQPVAPMRVLVADDNRVNRLVVQKILEREGHVITLAEDGEAALDALEAASFDLVLMDVNMPGTDGVTATKLYRFNALGRRHVPILGLTADATPEAAERCREAGMDGCLVKPIEPAQLAAAVAAHAPQRSAPPPAVTPIGAHPRFRPAAPPALDPAVTADLVALGGRRFVEDLVRDFLADAAELMETLETAVAQADPARFRSAAHALRSSAANIGARGVFALASTAEALPAGEVPAAGPRHAAQLAEELERVRAAGQDAADGAA